MSWALRREANRVLVNAVQYQGTLSHQGHEFRECDLTGPEFMQALSEIHALYLIPNASYFKLNINFKNQKKVKFTEDK